MAFVHVWKHDNNGLLSCPLRTLKAKTSAKKVSKHERMNRARCLWDAMKQYMNLIVKMRKKSSEVTQDGVLKNSICTCICVLMWLFHLYAVAPCCDRSASRSARYFHKRRASPVLLCTCQHAPSCVCNGTRNSAHVQVDKRPMNDSLKERHSGYDGMA